MKAKKLITQVIKKIKAIEPIYLNLKKKNNKKGQ